MSLTNIIRNYFINLSILVGMLALLITQVFPGFVSGAYAQAEVDTWTEPANLSRSGGAANPLMVVDAEGRYHVLWEDTFQGPIYMHGDGIEWIGPEPVRLPFGIFVPRLIADQNGFIHAFWFNEQGTLFYSRVRSENFPVSRSWTTPQRLAEAALELSVVVDVHGRLHLGYVRNLQTADFPSGIYYRQASSETFSWSEAMLLYESPYLRSLTRENAHLQVETASPGDPERLYVVWDDRLRERVFLAKSADGGENWSPPEEVTRPEEGSVTAGPARIMVVASNNYAMLIWQIGGTEAGCAQLFQWSEDGGETWQGPTRMLEDVVGCAQSNQLIRSDLGFILMTVIQDQVYLLAWDGSRWSDPQVQRPLSSFLDVDRQRNVALKCRQAVLSGGNNLTVVGCDPDGSQDIWWLTRQLVEVESWFPGDPVWSPISPIAANSEAMFLDPAVLALSNGRIHLFWSQPAAGVISTAGTAIYYSRWDAGFWSQPLAVLASPEGKAEQPAVAVNPAGRLLVVWSGGTNGEIYFSQANSGQAVVASAWTQPQLLPSPQPVGSSPGIVVDREGVIYVVYAIPLNEERGIYLTRSFDGGENWTAPVRVFDAMAAGWAMVDKPRLALTGNGSLHLLWTRYSLPTGTGPQALYYARSQDQGDTWAIAEEVVDNPAVWSQVAGAGEQTVHRVWQELSSGRTTLWHEQSLDNGISWQRTAPVSIFGDTVGTPSLTWDKAGRLHLLQVIGRGLNSFIIQHWLWDGERWIIERSMDLGASTANSIGSLVASLSEEGELAVVLTGRKVIPESGRQQDNLLYTGRHLEIPVVAELLPSPATPTPIPTPTEIQPEPTLVPTVSIQVSPEEVDALQQDPGDPGNTLLRSLLGPIAAGLIVLVVLIFGARGSWFRRS